MKYKQVTDLSNKRMVEILGEAEQWEINIEKKEKDSD
jgi:hypothetical protein